jgi:ubiquinone/menaquinone biosynthesis C-methylase UbiE
MDFDKEAAVWDSDRRVKLADEVADAIIREVKPTKDMEALDFGCGTGLVTLRLQPLVRSITAVDNSQGMLTVLQDKLRKQGLTNVHPLLVDLSRGDRINDKFHLVVSSMTLHHVEDSARLCQLWFDLLLPGGWLGIADLDTEDGSFHGDNTGVFHLGFGRPAVQALLRRTGFDKVRVLSAASMVKKVPGEGARRYTIFLAVGRK